MASDKDTTIQELKDKVAKFVNERDWQKYHQPKEVAVATVIEASELLELFEWDREPAETIKKNPEAMKLIKEELADVISYCLSMANQLDIDVTRAMLDKIKKNEEKYPVEKYKGKYKKYNRFVE